MDTAIKLQLSLDKQNWIPVKFGDVVFEPKENTKDPINEGIRHVVGLEHIESNYVHLRKSSSLESTTTFSKKFAVGDVLFGRRRAYLKKAALASFNGICSGDITVFRAKNELLLPELLPFIVHNEKFFDYAVKHSAGGLSPRVKFKDLANYELLLPPKDQQAELAELLWANDAYVESNRSMLMKNETLLLTYSKFLFSEGTGTPRSLSNIGELLMGQSPSGSTINENEDGLPFLQGNAEFGDKYPTTKKYTTAPKKIVPSDSILISVRAPVGDLNIADKEYCIGRGLAGLYIEDPVLRNYIYHFLKYARLQLERNSTGSTFKAINKATLSELKCFIPDRINLINNSNQLNQITKVRDNQKHILKTTQELLKSLINQIF